MRYSKILLFFILIYMIYQCKDESTVNRAYPRVNTLGIIEISESGVQVSGQIYEAEGMKIIDHGFVYASISDPYYNDVAIEESELFFEKLSLGEVSGNQTYEAKLENNLINGVKYLLKAYATTENYTIYGDSIIFTSKGGQLPIITKIEPDTAYFGDTISIHGKHFSMQNHSNMVWFGSIDVEPIKYSDTLVVAKVPNNILNVLPKIKVVVGGVNIGEYANPLIIQLPYINSITPNSLFSNQNFVLNGKFLSRIESLNIGDKKVNDLNLIGENIIKGKLPANIKAGEQELKISYLDTIVVFENRIRVLHPQIDSVFPIGNLWLGDYVYIKGKNLNKLEEINIDNSANSWSRSDSLLKFQLHSPFHNKKIIGKYENFEIKSSETLSWRLPVFDAIEKDVVVVGEMIYVSGENFLPHLWFYYDDEISYFEYRNKNEGYFRVPEIKLGKYNLFVKYLNNEFSVDLNKVVTVVEKH